MKGVALFFGISGFLICSRLLEESHAKGSISLRAFYIRRAFRILPPALWYLVVVGVLGRFGSSKCQRPRMDCGADLLARLRIRSDLRLVYWALLVALGGREILSLLASTAGILRLATRAPIWCAARSRCRFVENRRWPLAHYRTRLRSSALQSDLSDGTRGWMHCSTVACWRSCWIHPLFENGQSIIPISWCNWHALPLS